MQFGKKRASQKPIELQKHREDPDEPSHLLADRKQLGEVRKARWGKLLKGLRQTEPFNMWAERMAILHKSSNVKVWENEVPWITALFIVRYGENEAFWPPLLTEEDMQRAIRWETGAYTPKGVEYLPFKEIS